MIAINITKGMQIYEEIKNLHEKSFPSNERYSMEEIFLLLRNNNIKYKAFIEDGVLCGTLLYIYGNKLLYVFYIAVNDKIRSKGYGTRILDWLKQEYNDKTIVLNIEPIDDSAGNAEQREKRQSFYYRNGFVDTKHILDDDSGIYSILATSKDIDLCEYESLILQLGFGTYNPVIK